MKHQRFYEYQITPDDIWHPVSAEELLFHIIPSGNFTSYRMQITNIELPAATVITEIVGHDHTCASNEGGCCDANDEVYAGLRRAHGVK